MTAPKRSDDGGPAFPCEWVNDSDCNNTSPNGRVVPPGGSTPLDGMTLRDYFAAKAMQAAATNPVGADGFTFEERAAWAYQQADAMLKARRR